MLRELSSEWKTLIKKFEWEIWRERKFSFSSLCHIIIFLCWLGPDHHRDRWGKNYKFVIFDPRLHWDFAAQICWVCGVVGINHKTRKKSNPTCHHLISLLPFVFIFFHLHLVARKMSGKKIHNFASSIFMVVLLLLHFLAMLASSNTTLPPIINTRNYYIVLLEGSSMSSRTWLWRFSGGYESVFVMPRRVWGIS